MFHVCHITSAHDRYDTRIFLKECVTAATSGLKATLIVADGEGDEVCTGVNIIDVGHRGGRVARIMSTSRKVCQVALTQSADIYHLHDPELLVWLPLLKGKTSKVVFDAHEDLPKQIKDKYYINPMIRGMVSWLVAFGEKWIGRRLDGIVTATPAILEKFSDINENSINVNNYPLLDELAPCAASWEQKGSLVCYIGGIADKRGVQHLVDALALTESGAKLELGGRFNEPTSETNCRNKVGWQKVNFLGYVDRGTVRKALARSVAGIVTFLPYPNHFDAQPNKMFEYMSAGIPVIASDFTLWRKVIIGNDCGVCVDPTNPREIAGAIDFLIANREEAKIMGENGRRAIKEKYNWSREWHHLLDFYQKIL